MALHLCIGVFDAVHAGHRAVLASAKARARAEGGEVVALTFEPHPSRVLRPESPTPLILSRAQKEDRLAEAGADRVVHQRFDTTHRAMAAEDYAAWLEAAFPGLRSVHVGENFRFGSGRRGDPALLARTGAARGIEVRAVEPVQVDGGPASSSRIRAALAAGEVGSANRMLIRPYEAEGVVTPGRQLGRRLGLPTLNLPWAPELSPAFGVYAAEVMSASGIAEPAVMNWGVRPTVEAGAVAPLLEAHLLRPSGLIPVPGDTLKVRWLGRIRAERTFAGLDELRAQVGRDKAEAARLLGLHT
jgi:riboflavin kinase / FMN adenylyltransferase